MCELHTKMNGLFIELEGKEDQILKLAQELGLKEKIIVTYWDIFEEWKKDQNKEELRDNIVFPDSYVSEIKNFK